MATVMCRKLGRELEGFEKPPWPGELGLRVQREISREAWQMWLDHAKTLINEYRLNLGTDEAQAFIAEQMQEYLWGAGAALPPDWVPE